MATLETIESKTVKRLRSIFTLVALLANAGTGFAQGFMNLNFEAANTSSYASSGFIPTNNAIPGWTIYMESTYYPIVAYNTIALDGESVDLEGTNSQYGPYPIQGNYSVFVQGGSSADPNRNGASIMQTGQIPAWAQSITYRGGALQVTFSGQALTFNAVGSGSGYTIWQANISSYAGETGQLEFSAPWQTSGLLDNIQFSANAVPEPTTVSLSALGLAWLALRQWKKAKAA